MSQLNDSDSDSEINKISILDPESVCECQEDICKYQEKDICKCKEEDICKCLKECKEKKKY